jgi:hypothetical protein
MMNYQELLQSPILSSQIIKVTQKAAQSGVPVLIQGEQGTGKELTAKIIHHMGDWKFHRFYRIDCQILAIDAFYAQLFRLIDENRFGGNPATLYLKEVGYLSLIDQLKLLELIENERFENGSGIRTIKNVRFISSTSENLKEKIAQGKFSEDLYFRLNTLSIHLPPLRDRVGEISVIAQYILEENIKKMKIRRVSLSSEVLKLFENYWWPGNLKELEHVIIQSAILSDRERIMEKDLFFETEMRKNSFHSFLDKTEVKPPQTGKGGFDSSKIYASSTFFMELVHRIKNPLVSIKTFTQLLKDKFNDPEFKDFFYRIVTEDIEKIDTVLNGLLGYIKVNHPIEKKNTVHSIIDDVLKKYNDQIEHKNIKILRKYETDLPETIIHDEQLRYILNSLFQYAIPAIPLNGSIGFLTKSHNGRKEGGEEKVPFEKEKGYIEILMVFSGYKKPIESLETLLGIPSDQEKELTDLEIRLIKEMIQKNRGVMKFEVYEKKLRTVISLQFPVERRRVIYYQSVNNS